MTANAEVYANKEYSTRIPPQSVEVEVAVLGAVLRDAESVNHSIEVLRAGDFYKPAHQKIFKAVTELFNRGEAVDLATVSAELERVDELMQCGGRAYLVEVADSVYTAANIKHHCQIVLEKSVLRQLIQAAGRIQEQCNGAYGDVDGLLDEAEANIFRIAEAKLRRDVFKLGDLLPHTFEQLERYRQRGGGISGHATGFDKLDDLTSGFHNSDLIVLAGRPSMGKTAFALNIVENMAVHSKIPCAIFSLEMSKEQVAERILTSHARVSGHLMRQGRLRNEDSVRLWAAADDLYGSNILIDDTAAISVLEVRAKARRMKAQHKIGLVVVDYLQMMHGPRNAENRQQEVSVISRSLKSLAKELELPVLALSQLSRQVEQRGGDRRPQLSDLRDSGSIEQDADVVMFVYRPERYGITEEKGQSLENTAEIIIGKQRNGPTGTVHLTFLKEYTRFENRADTRVVGPPPTAPSGPPPNDAPY